MLSVVYCSLALEEKQFYLWVFTFGCEVSHVVFYTIDFSLKLQKLL